MIRRIWAIFQKELIQTVRDRSTLAILLAIPLIQLILFAYAIRMNIKHIPLAVADQSLDDSSRSYLSALTNSEYFDIALTVPGQSQVITAIDAGQAKAGVIIPPDFPAHVARGDAQVLLLVDGSDPFTTQSAFHSASAIAEQQAIGITMGRLSSANNLGENVSLNPLVVNTRILYNPDQKDLWFLIPGLIAMLLQTQTIALTSLSVVREREMGTIEQILVTPIRPGELMLGKSLSNMFIALFNMLSILLAAVLWFKVPFQGDFWLFLGLSMVYVLSGLALGLLISAVSQNQRQAQQLMMMVTLVGLIISGFVFPRYAMPQVLQVIGNIFPLTQFIPIARGVISKGVGFDVLWMPAATLAMYVVVIVFFAARLFRQRLD